MSALGSIIGRGFWIAARSTLVAAAVVASGVLIVDSLNKPDAHAAHETDDDDAKAKVPSTDGRVVRIDRDGQQNGGIESAAPSAMPYQDLVRAYGTVLALDRLTALYNTAMTDATQLQAAEVKAAASRRANDRVKEFLKVFSTAKAQAEAAEAAYQIDSAGVDAAGAQIEALKNIAIQDWGSVLGEAVANRTPLATNLVHRKTALVQVSLQPGAVVAPPRRLSFLVGTAQAVEGQLLSEATQLDPKMQSAGFLYAVPMTPDLLPGTSVLAYLPKGNAEPGVGIPSSAVVWQAGKPWMYLRTAPDTFERHAIDAAAAPTPDGGYIVPAKSLPRDKPIVVAGAEILLSQEMRTQIPADEDDH